MTTATALAAVPAAAGRPMLTAALTSTWAGPPFGVTTAAQTEPDTVRQTASTVPEPDVATVGSLASPPVPTSWAPNQPDDDPRSVQRLPPVSRQTSAMVPLEVATALGLPATEPLLSGIGADQAPSNDSDHSVLSVAFQNTSICPGAWLTAAGADKSAIEPTFSCCGVDHVSAPKNPVCDCTCQRLPAASSQNASICPGVGETSAG